MPVLPDKNRKPVLGAPPITAVFTFKTAFLTVLTKQTLFCLYPMRKPLKSHHLLLPFLLLLLLRAPPFLADVGTAASYGPPYLPTVCYGSDASQFPAGNMFAAAGAGIWDNGASCGREYLVRCLSSKTPKACVNGGPTIQVTVVDLASSLNSIPSVNGTTMVLSDAAYRMIASLSVADINIEFTQV